MSQESQEQLSGHADGVATGTMKGTIQTLRSIDGEEFHSSFRYRYELSQHARLRAQLARAQEILFRQGSSAQDPESVRALSQAVDRFVRGVVPPAPRRQPEGAASTNRSGAAGTAGATAGVSRRRKRLSNSQGRFK